MHCGMFSHTSGFYPLDASTFSLPHPSAPPAVTIKMNSDITKHSLGVKIASYIENHGCIHMIADVKDTAGLVSLPLLSNH